jgi:hypothetical protein
MIALPKVGAMGLFHDDIPLSHSLFDPVSTLFAALGILALLAAALALRKRQPLLAFGVLFFLAGHSLESTVIPLEITFEHRNYLPMYGILLIIFYYLLYPLAHLKSLRLRQLGAVLMLGLFAAGTAIRADHWGNLFLLSITEVTHHPLSSRANGEMGAMYGILATTEAKDSEQYYQLALKHFEISTSLQKNSADGLFGLIYYTARLSKTIERDWLTNLERRLEKPPFVGNSGTKLSLLVFCQAEGSCKLAENDLMPLLDAALRNPGLHGRDKASVLSSLSYHLNNVNKDTQGAVRASYQAIEADPVEPEYRKNLVYTLITANRLDEARKQLDIAKKLTYITNYAEQETWLNDAYKSVKH